MSSLLKQFGMYVEPVHYTTYNVFTNEKLLFQVLLYSKCSDMYKDACLFQGKTSSLYSEVYHYMYLDWVNIAQTGFPSRPSIL